MLGWLKNNKLKTTWSE